MRISLFLMGLVLLSIGFQNCSQTKINTQSVDSPSSRQAIDSGNGQGYDGLSGGNGQGYDGKMQLAGNFYRWTPGYSCNLGATPTASWYQVISYDVSGTGRLGGDLCTPPPPSNTNPVMMYETEVYAYNLNLLLYRGHVFERSSPPMPSPFGDPAIVCRTGSTYDYQEVSGTTVVVRQGVSSPANYSAEIYWGEEARAMASATTLTSYSVPPFAVAAASVPGISQNFSRTDFNLQISMVANNQQKYWGQGLMGLVYNANMTALISQKPYDIPLICFVVQ